MKIAPIGFQSWQEYINFGLAREFMHKETQQPFVQETSFFEKTGDLLAKPILGPFNLMLEEFRNPLMVAALTSVALLAATFVFYPLQTWALATKVFPFLSYINASHLQCTAFAFTQTAIAGLGIRTLGRLENKGLMEAFRKKEIVEVPLGAVDSRSFSIRN